MSRSLTTAAAEPVPRPRHAVLRAATRQAHARLDARFPCGLGDRADYRAYLRGMHRFVGDLHAALAVGASLDGGRDATRRDRCAAALARLATDLASLRHPPLAPRGSPPRLGDEWARLGWEYVLSGSARGARILLRDVRRIGYEPRRHARFLEAHAGDDALTGVLERIERPRADPAADQSLHDGALHAFAHADDCFRRARDEDVPTAPDETTA